METFVKGDGSITARPPTEMEVAWAAGLFEGEGCWNAYVRQNGRVQMQVRLAMTDRDVVERFAGVVGCGAIRGSHSGRPNDKYLWTWCVYEATQVRRLVALFLPYMGARRRARALEVLTLGGEVQEHCGKRTHCPNGHPYVGENLDPSFLKDGKRRCRICRNAQSRDRARARLGITPDRFRVKEQT